MFCMIHLHDFIYGFFNKLKKYGFFKFSQNIFKDKILNYHYAHMLALNQMKEMFKESTGNPLVNSNSKEKSFFKNKMVVISCHILVHSFLHTPSCKKYPILILFIQLDQVMMNNTNQYNNYYKLVCILEKIIKGMNIMFLFLKIWDLSSDLCAI